MNSYMRVYVQVIANKAAAQLAAVRGGVDGVGQQVGKVNRMEPLGARHQQALTKFGNSLQWTGRMLQYNFTLPLVLAGAAATTWAMEQDKAFTHVAKVYGDTTEAAAQFRREQGLGAAAAERLAESYKTDELKALDEAFTAISNHYGVQKKEVLEVAGAWAAAGASGRDLAESVNQTMQAIIIGDMDAADATKALISIQAQYNLSTKELQATLADLNSVENQTGASMGDLIVGFEKAAGVARSAGVETQQLAAYMAALVPATGSASTAGNALKTIISRLMGPTKEASQVMEAMGLNISSVEWQSATVTERLALMAVEFQGMGKAAQNAASSVIASRWQINKFDVLMRELVSSTGYYAKALESVEDQGASFTRMQNELQTVLESDPRKMQRFFVMLQNASSEIIQPLIPHIIYLMQQLAKLANAFADMDPHVQKIILAFLVFLALVGPVVRYLGALTTLFGVFGRTAIIAGSGLTLLTGILGSILTPFLKLGTILTGVIARMIMIGSGGLAAAAGAGFQMVAAASSSAGRIIMGQGLAQAFGWVWATVVNLFKAGTAAAFAVEQVYNAASVTVTQLSVGARLRAIAAGAAASVKAEQAAGAARAGANSAANAAMVATDQAASSARWGSWSLFYSYLDSLVMAHTMAFYSLNAGAQSQVLALESASHVARRAGWSAYFASLIAMLGGHWTGHLALEAGSYMRLLAIESSYMASSQGMWAAYISWRIGLARAYNAAIFGIEAGASSSRLALNAAATTTTVATTVAGNTAVVASHAAAGSAIVATNVAAATATLGIWASMRAKLIALLVGLVALVPRILGGILMVIRGIAMAIVSPWGLAIAAVLGVLYYFRDQIAKIWNNIVGQLGDASTGIGSMFEGAVTIALKAFNALPQGVQNALQAVVNIVRAAAIAVYEWFSYINPFARHSPSLVENVTNGMREVNRQFATLSGIKKHTTAAYNEVARFGKLTAKLGISAAKVQQAEDRASIKKAGGGGAALASYNRLVGIMNKLTPSLKRAEATMNAQQRVVDAWSKKVDAANRALNVQNKILDDLTANQQRYQDKLDQAEDALQNYASAPLIGMRDMEDQIFANQMAQTKLRYEMMKLEEVTGTYDEIKSKIESVNGAIELLRGRQESLRDGGAGGDILSAYDDQIAKLEQQKDKYAEASEKLGDMQSQLDALGKAGEKLDLTKSMKFDELQHQIERAAESTKEMSFDEIIKGISDANEQMATYRPLVDAATQAVAKQQAIVDRMTASRDALQDKLDIENDKLSVMRERYDEINDAVRAVEQAINDVTSASSKVNAAKDAKKQAAEAKKGLGGKGGADYQSPGLQNFLAAGDADFADPGGLGIPPRKDWSSQADDIRKFTEDLAFSTADMFEQINPFKPLMGKAKAAWDWIKGAAKSAWDQTVSFISGAFEGVNLGGGEGGLLGNLTKGLSGAASFITGVLKTIGNAVGSVWDLIGPDIIQIGQGIWDGLVAVWKEVGPEVAKFADLIKPIGQLIKDVWDAAKPVLAIIGGAFAILAKLIFSAVAETIGPVLKNLAEIIGGIVRFIRGAFELVIGILTGDFSLAWKGLKDIVSGAFKAIWGVIKGAGNLILKPIIGIVKGVFDIFVWLWNKLVKSDSPIAMAVEFIAKAFWKIATLPIWIFNNVVLPIIRNFGKIKDFVVTAFMGWWNWIVLQLSPLILLGMWIWDNVLKPVWNAFKRVWSDRIWPFLKGWWTGIKMAFAAIRATAGWFWNNVLRPLWERVRSVWNKYIWPFLKTWWSGIKAALAVVKALGNWFWENVLKPVWNWIKETWSRIKGELGKWWDRIKAVFSVLKGLGDWFKKNVMDKVFDRITGAWTRIKKWLQDNKDMLTSPMKSIVNTVIKAVNKVIGGLNRVSDILPGVEWNISPIPELAQGGPVPTRRGNRGFQTNGARAIVGEGKANYPEFVIPTDPTYRSRAKGLLSMAANKLGMGSERAGILGDTPADIVKATQRTPGIAEAAIPQYSIGGWIGDMIKGGGKAALSGFKSVAKGAVNLAMKPPLWAANKVLDGVGWAPPRTVARFGLNKIKEWTARTNEAANEAKDEASGGAKVRAALAWARGQAGKPYVWGGVGPGGYDCSGFMSAIANHLSGRPLHSRLGATASFPWGGFVRGSQPMGFTIGSTPSYGSTGVGHMAGTLGGVNVESRGGQGVVVGSSARGWNDGGFSTAAYKPLKTGGVALRRHGPTLAALGDGRYDEAVVPLPKDWRSNGSSFNTTFSGGKGSGDTYINVDKLVLPNITSGDDVDELIENLKLIGSDN